jgi:N-acetylneuraminate synthase
MKPFLIAEIGINHNGDLKIAKKLIDHASEANFDAVKFQKRDIETVYTKEYLDEVRKSPWGNTQREQKNGLEFSENDYDVIDNYCKKKNIEWFASAWDLKSQKFLQKYKLKYNKVASPMLGNLPLLKAIAEEKKYTFISTGMSTLEEIDKVVNIFKEKNCPFELMHCNSSYPMKDTDANLSCIKTLTQRYNCKVGYSGHENSLISISVIAVALGATSIERHITLDRTMYGSDQAASIESKKINDLSALINKVHLIVGDGKKFVRKEEEEGRKKLRITKN